MSGFNAQPRTRPQRGPAIGLDLAGKGLNDAIGDGVELD
jgi:hypothetical protein